MCTPCIFCHTYSIYVRLRHTYELSVYYHKGRTFALVLYHHPHRSSPFLQMYKVYVNIAMSWMIHFTGPEIRVFYVFVLSGKGRRGSNVRSREGDLVGPVIYVVKSRLTMVMVLSSWITLSSYNWSSKHPGLQQVWTFTLLLDLFSRVTGSNRTRLVCRSSTSPSPKTRQPSGKTVQGEGLSSSRASEPCQPGLPGSPSQCQLCRRGRVTNSGPEGENRLALALALDSPFPCLRRPRKPYR